MCKWLHGTMCKPIGCTKHIFKFKIGGKNEK